MSHSGRMRRAAWRLLLPALLLLALLPAAHSVPAGPVVTVVSNETASSGTGTVLNTSGGSVTTMMLNATSQNLRWKAYVGNVTGKLTLDDANSFTLYDWSLSSIAGEVYATRNSSGVSWSNINCSNSTHLFNEDIAMNHTSPDDNITKTFNAKNHTSFFVGTIPIPQSSCYSIHTYVNDTGQSADFQEAVLYDGTTTSNGKIVYATTLETDKLGFNNNRYDFQMIVPERGYEGWSSSTAYYFYAELT